MPDLTQNALAQLAASGAPNPQIVAALGRKMTPEERQIVERVRVVKRLKRLQAGPASTADRVAKHVAKHSQVKRRQCADPKRRARLEKDDAKWIKWYCAESFWLAFEKPHYEIIAKTRAAVQTGRDTVIAAERGIGKSYLEYALVIKLALTGEQDFPVYLPWGEKNKAQGFGFWLDCLAFNERIADDYPEICDPFVHAQGVPQRLSGTTWEDTGEPTHSRIAGSSGIIVFPDGRGVIGSSTINGNPRGLNYKHKGGKPVRPTMAFVDDVQDDKVAHSQGADGLVGKTIRTVNGAIRGLKRAGADFSIIMTGNCIEPGDVMDHFLNQSGWNAVRVSCVETWPGYWGKPETEGHKLLEQWGEMWLAGDKGETAFFRKHGDTICKGMVLNSPKAYMANARDKAKDKRNRKISKPVNAPHAVLREYFTMGNDAFMAERQQAPVKRSASTYELTEETIASRVSGYPRLHCPVGGVITCGVDINYVGFNWSLVHGDQETRSRKVIAHGIWPERGGMIPKGVTVDAACNMIRRSMATFTASVLDSIAVTAGTESRKMDMAGFDLSMGAWQDAGMAAIKELGRKWIYGIKAFGAKGYKPQKTDLRQGKGWRLTDWPRLGRVIVLNSDMWREMVQRGFLAQPTEAGAVSLYTPDASGANRQLAQEVASEHIMGQTILLDGSVYQIFGRTPGIPNDRADSLVYACALTGVMGIGEEQQQKSQRKRYTQAQLSGGR